MSSPVRDLICELEELTFLFSPPGAPIPAIFIFPLLSNSLYLSLCVLKKYKFLIFISFLCGLTAFKYNIIVNL